jgi:GNAT superfamily N-acetyltransferase
MQIIELTSENIETYLSDCLETQTYLIKPEEKVNEVLMRETAEDSHSYMIGVIVEDRLLGLGVISKLVHPVHKTGYINNIVVHPDARGQGLFSVIMDDLEAKAKDWGCDDLALTCSREQVQGMYEKRGYTEKNTKFYLRGT